MSNSIPNLVKMMDSKAESEISARPARSLHASAIGHPCARCLMYDQVRPASKHDLRLERIFRIGNIVHESVLIEAMEACKFSNGEYSIRRNEETLPPNRYGIGGRIDFAICWRDPENDRLQSAPVEVKSMSDRVWDSIDSVEDIKEHKYIHVRNYYGQMNIYLLLMNKERGAFLLVNKNTGAMKWVEIVLDLEFAEGLLKKAEIVRDAVAAWRKSETDAEREAASPERIPFDPSVCPDCPHFKVCIPDVHTEGGVVIDPLWEGEVEAWCNILAQTEEAAKQNAEANDKLKDHVAAMCRGLTPGQKRTMVTESWYVQGTMGNQRTVYEVPDEVKAQYKKTADPIVRKRIERIDRNDAEA